MNMPRFEFPAVVSMQGYKKYYMAAIPFGALSRLLAIDIGNTLERSQRDVSDQRAKKVSEYIQDNPKGFVIPGLTGVINSNDVIFTEHKDGCMVGTMSVSMDAEIKLFDGQHRAVGIIEAIKQHSDLRSNTVPVQLFTDMSLAERQQAFSDINGNAKLTSKSLNQAYNKRDQQTQELTKLASLNIAFYGKVEFEKNSVSGRSEKLFALKTLIESNRVLLGLGKSSLVHQEIKSVADDWWSAVCHPAMWSNSDITPADGRNEFITFHAVGLLALARLGYFVIQHNEDINDIAEKLNEVDFSRANKDWVDVCVTPDGKMISGVDAQLKTALKIAEKVGLQLTTAEKLGMSK